MTFEDLDLHPQILKNISAQGYESPTPIQEQAVPLIDGRRDVLGIAKTGSGKTASFVWPILDYRLTKRPTPPSRHPKVLVLVPTRELAVQVGEVFTTFAVNLPQDFKVMAVYGGVSINPQMKNLYGVDILVATPGRLLDLKRSSAVEISMVETLVLDEADKMLNMGFKSEMEEIFKLLPKKRQNLLFSATLSEELEGIKKLLLVNPAIIKVGQTETEGEEQINLSGYFVSNEKKGPLLRYLIKKHNMKQLLIFTSSSKTADRVAYKLVKNGVDAKSIHGKKSQGARQSALNAFKAGNLQILVSTDLISRGIDIDALPYVINYELPRSPKDFVHRVGRTGRAESKGMAITFVTRDETHHFKVILKKMKRYIDMVDSETMIF